MDTTARPPAKPQPHPTPAKQTSELKEIANVPEMVKAFGKEYEIRKFVLGQWAQAMEYAGYIGVLMVQATRLTQRPTQDELISFVAQGIGVSSPAFLPLISIATKEPLQWLEEQEDVVGGLRIFAKVVEKNKSFFTQQNLDEIKAVFADLLPTIQAPGADFSTT